MRCQNEGLLSNTTKEGSTRRGDDVKTLSRTNEEVGSYYDVHKKAKKFPGVKFKKENRAKAKWVVARGPEEDRRPEKSNGGANEKLTREKEKRKIQAGSLRNLSPSARLKEWGKTRIMRSGK